MIFHDISDFFLISLHYICICNFEKNYVIISKLTNYIDKIFQIFKTCALFATILIKQCATDIEFNLFKIKAQQNS
jgi:hypothetical protein